MAPRHTLSTLRLLALTLAFLAARDARAAQAGCEGWSVSAGWWTRAYAVTTADLYRVEGGTSTFVERSTSSVLFPTGGGTLAFSGLWTTDSLGGTFVVRLVMTIYSGLDHVPTESELAFFPASQTRTISGTSQTFVCMAPEPACGNGVVESGEQCDDGNSIGGDGCSSLCTHEPYGCTFTIGYWKTHHTYAKNRSQQISWPISQDTQLCGQSWLDVLHTRPRGNAWVILAHQYVAARLNAANGASSGAGTEEAIDDAEAILSDCTVTAAERTAALDLAALLDSYNNGAIGPGHCD